MTTRDVMLGACAKGDHRHCNREGRIFMTGARIRTICACKCHEKQPPLPPLGCAEFGQVV